MLRYEDYSVLDELPVLQLPPRSVLFRLEPIGLGTGFRESLTSYVERLADAHCVSVASLAKLPSAGSYRRSFKNGSLVSQPSFNCGGVTSNVWASYFNDLTARIDLGALTLAPIAGLVNQRDLVTRHRRWCPECLRESMETGSPHSQLIWQISCVSACTKHELRLVAGCECNTRRDERSRARRHPGYCTRCGRPIWHGLTKSAASKDQLKVAQTVHDLLAHHRFDGGGWTCSDDKSGKFLSSIAARHYDGKAAWLARALGVSKSNLHGWMRGASRPTLSWLVSVAVQSGSPIADVLSGHSVNAAKPQGVSPVKRQARRSITAEHRAQLAADLASVLSSDSVPPLQRLADQLDVPTWSLHKYFPKESAEVVARWKAQNALEQQTRRERSLNAFRAKAEQLAEVGILPTSRRVLESAALPAGRFTKFRVEMSRILDEVRSQDRSKVE